MERTLIDYASIHTLFLIYRGRGRSSMIKKMEQIGFPYAGDIKTDVLVMGGGSAGIGAAAGVAKSGKKALLIDKNSSLGGMATVAAVSTICGAYSADKSRKIIGGIYQEWMDELKKLEGIKEAVDFGQHRADICDHHLLKVAADRLLLHYNVDLLYRTQIIGVKCDNEFISYILISNKEGVFRVFADKYIDCTGDADIAAQCGAPYEMGDENGDTQAATTVFKMANANMEVTESVSQEEFNDIIIRSKENNEYNLHRPSGVYMSSAVGNSIICNMNWISGFSPLVGREITEAEIEGREASVEYGKFLKNKVPGFENSYLAEIAEEVGIRETRRIIGKYVLTEHDIMTGAKFDDAIAWSAWPVEYHDPAESTAKKTYLEQDYQIPYSSLIPQGVENLIVAGRSISTTQFANASTRVMAPCLAIGQAAGVAAVISIEQDTDFVNVDIKLLQKMLSDQGAIL